MKSNIRIGSNVFHCETDDPRQDKVFVEQLVDYDRLKDIFEKSKSDTRIAKISQIQEKIVQTELRCVFAKNDPCWGYNIDLKCQMCTCINEKCSRISKCNPKYSKEMRIEWTMKQSDREAYGSPEKLHWYYFVDMVSDEEMARYDYDSENESIEFVIARNSIEQRDDSRKYRIDPVSGRKMVVVGHRWKLDNIGSYEGDYLEPIWDFVDEIFEEKVVVRKKAKKIKKLVDTELESPYNNEELVKVLQEKIVQTINLSMLSPDLFSGSKSVIIVANQAEKAFVSSMLLKSDIEHGYEETDSVLIVTLDDFSLQKDTNLYILTNSLLGKANKRLDLSKLRFILDGNVQIVGLDIKGREYFSFSGSEVREKWCCRNMYGVTHMMIDRNDLLLENKLEDGVHFINIEKQNDSYILETDNNIIGSVSDRFIVILTELQTAGEIVSFPERLKGVALLVKDGNIQVLGMGNMKFSEY